MLLKERYWVEKELGRGGFGIVYLARDRRLHSRPVVVKVLLEAANPDPWFQKKFQQEIEALARIDHPGVVGVLDVGETPDGKPFLVMQYVEGITLRAAFREGPMELRRVGKILRQIGQALGAAHDRGVHHRDLKPENIMLQRLGPSEEHVKLIDFGIATVKDSQAAGRSLATKLAGSYAYMAPEQFRGQPSAASDLYALGVIAYEMLTGRRPFPDSPYPQVELQREGVKIRPRELRPELPESADAVVLRALSYEPEKRQSGARQLGEELGRAVEGQSLTPARSGSQGPPRLEMAHVLFLDLVGYSQQPLDRQTEMIGELQQIVRETAEFRQAQASGEIVSLPTGDGMALVFFHSPEAPVRCALEVARAVRGRAALGLRMGVHTGPVYRIADINANRNVAGGGINIAQRVMDCADAGHILVSKTVADLLRELTRWAVCLQDLGEHEVKHGERVHLFNVCVEDAGNPAWPRRLRRPRKRQTVAVAAGVGVAVAAVILAVVLWRGFFGAEAPKPPPAPGPGAGPAEERAPPAGKWQPQARGSLPALSAGGATADPSPKVEAPPVPQWPTFRGNLQRTGVAPVTGPQRGREAWRLELERQLRAPPVIGHDGTVYIGSTRGTLFAVREGAVPWRYAARSAILTSAWLDPGGLVRVTTESGERHSLNLAGQQLSVTAADPRLTARSPDGREYYTEGATLRAVGDPAWRVELDSEASTSPAAGNDGAIYVGTEGGVLHCIERSGKIRWRYEAGAKITAAPAVKGDGDVIFGADRSLHCVRDGQPRWKFAAGGAIFSAPVVDRSGTIYFGSNYGNLHAVSELGQEVWRLGLGSEIHTSPALDRQGRLYVGSIHGLLYCISD